MNGEVSQPAAADCHASSPSWTPRACRNMHSHCREDRPREIWAPNPLQGGKVLSRILSCRPVAPRGWATKAPTLIK